jgi:putative copper export protein
VKTFDWETVRLFLHVLAATVWVGGQITLAALVPALRGTAEGVTAVAARDFNRIAWPAFGVLGQRSFRNAMVSATTEHPRASLMAIIGAFSGTFQV